MTHKTYIKFNAPLSKNETFAPSFLLKATIKILKAIFPMSNPDFDHLIDKVCVWKLEYDTKLNTTWREIGYDEANKAILAMPTDENAGYWTDNNFKLNDYLRFLPTMITEEEFEEDWKNFINNN